MPRAAALAEAPREPEPPPFPGERRPAAPLAGAAARCRAVRLRRRLDVSEDAA